jgi:hypothetical protein
LPARIIQIKCTTAYRYNTQKVPNLDEIRVAKDGFDYCFPRIRIGRDNG